MDLLLINVGCDTSFSKLKILMFVIGLSCCSDHELSTSVNIRSKNDDMISNRKITMIYRIGFFVYSFTLYSNLNLAHHKYFLFTESFR